MKAEKGKVVSIHYTLKNDAGSVLDSSEGRDPLNYLHGHGNIIGGLESALEGKASGEKLDVQIAPEDGYGVRDDNLLQSVPRTQFDPDQKIEPGMQFQAGQQIVTVTEVSDDSVTVDGNHPLAGETLHFSVSVEEIRDASEEEIAHGHVHGPGGHHH